MPLDPETGLLMFIAAGLAGVVVYTVTEFAVKVGPKLEPGDLLPAPPPNPPLPRFLYKPEVMASLRR